MRKLIINENEKNNNITNYEYDKINDDLLIKEQNKELKQIQQDLLDMNQIMESLNELVIEQGEQLDKIEETAENTDILVDDGVAELVIAEKYHKSSINKTIRAVCGGIVGGAVTGGIGSAFGYVPCIVGGGAGIVVGIGFGIFSKYIMK